MGNSIETSGQTGHLSDGASKPPQSAGRPQNVSDQASSQAQTFVDKAKTTAQNRVRSAANSGKTQAVETVSGLAQSLLLAGQQLQDQQSGAARLVEQTAERLDSVAQYLETTDLDQLVQRTENWARQNPALFVGAAFFVGVLGARFLKSSQPMNRAGPIGSSDGAYPPFSDREVPRASFMEEV